MLSTDALDTRGVWSRAHIPVVTGPQQGTSISSKRDTIYRNVVDLCVTTYRNVVVDRCVKVIRSLVFGNVTTDVFITMLSNKCVAINQNIVDIWVNVRSLVVRNVATDVSYHNVEASVPERTTQWCRVRTRELTFSAGKPGR